MKRNVMLMLTVGLALVLLSALELEVARPQSNAEAAPLQTVTIVGTFGGDNMGGFQAVLDDFTDRTAIATQYEQVDGPARLQNCTANGDCPDVALMPWPGLLAELGVAGTLVDLGTFVDDTELNANYTPTWIDLGTVGGTLYGVWFNVNNKSLVWYDPVEFANQGWTTPTNWTELIALSDQVVAGGGVPWSVGAEGGAASGWPLTDWFEDILLRSEGPDVYDELTMHSIPWTSTEVISAMTYFGQIFGNEDYQLGGKEGTLNTYFVDAMFPPLRDPPKAYLHRQASFAQGFIANEFPSQTAGVDYATFPFPDIDPTYGNAVMGAGDAAMMFHDSAAARALINYLITTDAGEIWIAQGQISPNRSVDFGLYSDPIHRAAAESMANADIFRFDLSDQMPSELHRYFWLAIQDIVLAAPNAAAMEAVLEEIETKASQFQQPVTPGQAATIHYTSSVGSETIIQIPAGAVSETMLFQHIPLDTVNEPEGYTFAGRAFGLQVFRDGLPLPGLVFDPPLTVTLTYSDTDVAGLSEEELSFRYWDGIEWSTDGITVIERDTEDNRLVVTIAHLSDFALFGRKAHMYLPLILRNLGP